MNENTHSALSAMSYNAMQYAVRSSSEWISDEMNHISQWTMGEWKAEYSTQLHLRNGQKSKNHQRL